MRTSDVIKIIFLGTIWGGSFAFIRVCAPIIGAVWFTLGRLVVASIVLIAWARWAGVDLAFRRYWKQYFVVGLLNTAGPWTLYAFAGKTISASYMSIINSSTPLMSAILGAWFLGEKMTVPKVIGLACGVLGVSLIAGWGPIAPTPEVLLAVFASILAALGYAVGGVAAKLYVKGGDSRAIAVGNTLFASLMMLPLLPEVPAASQWTTTVIASMIIVGVLSTGIGFPMFFQLIKDVGATKAQTTTFIVPVSGVLLGVLFLDEPMKLTLVFGGLLILVACALVLEIPLPGMRRRN